MSVRSQCVVLAAWQLSIVTIVSVAETRRRPGGALSSRYNISQTDEDTTGRDNILSAQIFGSHFQQLHSY